MNTKELIMRDFPLLAGDEDWFARDDVDRLIQEADGYATRMEEIASMGDLDEQHLVEGITAQEQYTLVTRSLRLMAQDRHRALVVQNKAGQRVAVVVAEPGQGAKVFGSLCVDKKVARILEVSRDGLSFTIRHERGFCPPDGSRIEGG